MQKLIILTGPSGSGISSSKFVFEELGYYIVDNAPSGAVNALLDSFSHVKAKQGFCLMPDLSNAKETYEIAKKDKRYDVKLILLLTQKSEILKRYVLSRHVHPRAILSEITLEKAIDLDINAANELRKDADFEIDTTRLTIKELRTLLYSKLEHKGEQEMTKITFMSFGLKNGIPAGIDMMFDVRVIPNPYWVSSLAPLSGLDQPVVDYMLSFDATKKLLTNITNYLDKYIPIMLSAKRCSYMIGICCSGGKHRSVFVADYLSKHYRDKYKTITIHRDSLELNKDK